MNINSFAKLTAISFVFMILMLPFALAGMVPASTSVLLKANNPQNQLVEITNIDEGITYTQNTNEFGHVLIDGSVFISAGDGDSIRAVIVACSNLPECTQTKTMTNDEVHFDFDIDFIFSCPAYVPCADPNQCTTCPEDTTPYETGTENCIEDECTEDIIDPFIVGSVGAILMALLLGLLMGDFGVFVDREKWQLLKYFKIWLRLTPGEKINVILKRTKAGELQVDGRSHGHAGHEGIHSKYIEHRNYKHPKGFFNPDYDEEGKFIGGDE